MLRGALGTPVRTSDAVGVLLVGTTLVVLSVVFVPAWIVALLVTPYALFGAPIALAPVFVLRGYYVRVVAGGLSGSPEAPSFVRWGRLYRDGVKSLAVSLALLLPLGVLIGLVAIVATLVQLGRLQLAAPASIDSLADPTLSEALFGIGTALLLLSGVGYLLVYTYLRPAALACFASTGRARDGLRPLRVIRIAADGDYLAGWLLAVTVTACGVVFAVPLAPFLVGLALLFAARIVAHALYGRGARRALCGDVANETGITTPEPGSIDPETGSREKSASEPTATADLLEPRSPPAPEIDPEVQTGRPVPLTATDIISDRRFEVPGDVPQDRSSTGRDVDEFEWGVAADDRIDGRDR